MKALLGLELELVAVPFPLSTLVDFVIYHKSETNHLNYKEMKLTAKRGVSYSI